MFVCMVVPANMLEGNNVLLPILPLIFGWREPIFSRKLAGAVSCFKTWARYNSKTNGVPQDLITDLDSTLYLWITCQYTLKIVCSLIMKNKHPENSVQF